MKYGEESQPRTLDQNRAMHKFFQLLSDSLNMAGLEMKVVLKGDTQIWWTPEAVKSYLWKALQKSMYQKQSTTELEKHEEITKIHEQLMHLLGEKHGLEYIPFPNDPDKAEKKSMLKVEKTDYPTDYKEPLL
jgi:hypothetical protein